MQRSIIRRAAVLLCGAGLAMAGLAAGGAPAASAAPATPAAPASGTTVAVPMSLDCAHLSAAARGYAASHNYCAGAVPASGVSPDNVEAGDCGTSYFYIDNLGGGNARFRWGFSSSAGNVVIRSLGVHWDNTRWGNSGYWPDNAGMLSSSYNATPRTVSTGSGTVSGYLDGWVTLWWGAVCTINYPWDSKAIS